MRFGTNISGLIVAFLAVGCQCYAQSSQGQSPSNIASTLYAANFASWTVPQGNNGPFSWSSSQVCTSATSGGATFKPFVVGTPILIRDTATPSNSEIVTPTAVNITGSGCSITVNPAHQHYSFYLTTATAGLQDAINYAIQNLGSGTALVLVTPAWAQLGGTTAMITPGAQGNTSISILDERSSVILPYIWQSTLYVAQPFATGGSGVTALAAGPGIAVSGSTGNVTVSETLPITSFTTTGTSGASTLSAGVLNIPQYQAAGNYLTLGTPNQTVTQTPTFGSTNPFTLCPAGGTTACDVTVNVPGGSNNQPFITFLNGGDVNFSSSTGGFDFLAASGHGFGFNAGSALVISSDAFGEVTVRASSNDFTSLIVNPGPADVGSAPRYFAACQHAFCQLSMTVPEVPDLQVTLAGVTEVKDNAGNAAVVCNQVDGCGSATNLAGGAANDVPYQTGAGATSFITPVNNAVLVTNGSGVPSESTTLPSGIAATTQPYTDSSTDIATTKFVSNTVGFVPPSGSTVWYVDLGDSRVAASALHAGNAPSDFIQSDSHFSGGKINVVKLGYPGETSCQIFANYSTTIHPYAVNGTTRTQVTVHNAMGVNDILLSNTVASAFSCIQQIITAEKADGMTVVQDTVYPVAVAPLTTSNGSFIFTPAWYPSTPDLSCITPLQAWTAYPPSIGMSLAQLNIDITNGPYSTAPDYVWDWASQVTDMWDSQYTCEGVHQTAEQNKKWAQYQNDMFGAGASVSNSSSAPNRQPIVDSLWVGGFVNPRQVIDNFGGANLAYSLSSSYPSNFPVSGLLSGYQTGTSFIDSFGLPGGGVGLFDMRAITSSGGTVAEVLKSDATGSVTLYNGLAWGLSSPTSITSSNNVCQVSGTNCPAYAPLASPAFTGTPTTPQIVGSGSTPTCTLGAASGSNSGSACASISGANLAGRITITTGTATTASATLATITFGGTVTTAPQGCRLEASNANAVGQSLMVFSNYPTTSGWTIGVGGTAVPASTTFTYSYSCF